MLKQAWPTDTQQPAGEENDERGDVSGKASVAFHPVT